MEIETGHRYGLLRLKVQNQQLTLTIQDRPARKKNIRPENSIGLKFMRIPSDPPWPAQVGGNGGQLTYSQPTESQRVRHQHAVVGTVDSDTCGIFGIGRDSGDPKMAASS